MAENRNNIVDTFGFNPRVGKVGYNRFPFDMVTRGQRLCLVQPDP
jgi:hypothetical protein